MTANQIAEMHTITNAYFMDFNELHNQFAFLGKRSEIINRDLIMLSWFIPLLKEFELTDSEIPYKGNRNRLEPSEYVEVLRSVNKITGHLLTYDFNQE
jgi:hypothetical protein